MSRISPSKRLAALAMLCALGTITAMASCNPDKNGLSAPECRKNADCQVGTVCYEYKCVSPDTIPDGGDAGTSADAGDAGTPDGGNAEFGKACSRNSDCPKGFCLPLDGGTHVCTDTCSDGGNTCLSGWSCGPSGQGMDVCRCTPSSEVCDGLDNDCNGVVDDPSVTDLQCLTQLGPRHSCARTGCSGPRCTTTADCTADEICNLDIGHCEAPDAGTSDGGDSDAGTTDAGETDAGTQDAGAHDAGPLEALAPAGTANANAPVNGIACEPLEQLAFHIHPHLQIYVFGTQKLVPSNIGFGTIADGGSCVSWVHTHDTSGVIHIESPSQRDYTLGDFFAVWGQPLSANQVGPAQGAITAFVDGELFTGDITGIVMHDHTLVQLDVGEPIVGPQPYTFPNGL